MFYLRSLLIIYSLCTLRVMALYAVGTKTITALHNLCKHSFLFSRRPSSSRLLSPHSSSSPTVSFTFFLPLISFFLFSPPPLTSPTSSHLPYLLSPPLPPLPPLTFFYLVGVDCYVMLGRGLGDTPNLSEAAFHGARYLHFFIFFCSSLFPPPVFFFSFSFTFTFSFSCYIYLIEYNWQSNSFVICIMK
jgi:hypothetical protein